MTFTCRS